MRRIEMTRVILAGRDMGWLPEHEALALVVAWNAGMNWKPKVFPESAPYVVGKSPLPMSLREE